MERGRVGEEERGRKGEEEIAPQTFSPPLLHSSSPCLLIQN